MNLIKKNITKIKNKEFVLKTKTGKINKKRITRDDEILAEIEENRNHSWYKELWNRNKNSLNDIALIYRGNKITYKVLFEKITEYAKSMKELGCGVNSEIPVCVSNSPEIVYLMGAASLIGSKLNIFGPDFPDDYINEIINKTGSNILFIEDNSYCKICNALTNCNIDTIIMNSLRDSLDNNFDPYDALDKKTGLFENKVEKLKEYDCRIISQKDFLKIGSKYNGKLDGKIGIDDDFVITYTSGSTNEKRPKAIVHSSRNFITIARYHDKDINGITTKSFTSLAHIPTFSNTNLVSCISDSLMQGAKLALEPIYHKDFFINSILIYNPNYVAATKSFWISLAKKIMYDTSYDGVRFDNLLLAFVCGEPYELNEEKFINNALKKVKAGTAITHTPMSLVRTCEAAGDCEHGSIFYTLFRSYANKKPKNLKSHEASGLTPFSFVDVAVLDENGKRLLPNQIGRIVANSPCTMKRYHNNPEATKKFFIQDIDGKFWADMSVYGYIDKNGKVYVRGRIPEKEELIPPFVIAKKILRDNKNILSCEVVKDENTGCYIAHLELQPDANDELKSIVYYADLRCSDLVHDIGTEIYFRIHDFEEGFSLTKSGKRDVKILKREGLSLKCVRPEFVDDELKLVSYEDIKKQKRKIK